MPKLKFTQSARHDLLEIRRHIASSNPTAAKRFVEEVIDRVMMLEESPRAGPAREELGKGVRALLLHRNYAAIYRMHVTDVEILRVCHLARDVSNLRFGAAEPDD